MSGQIGGDDLVIRVRLDTTQAKQEWSKQEKAARGVGSAASFGLANAAGMAAKAAASALSFIFGESAAASMTNIRAVGSNVGRTTFLGQQIERDTAERTAHESARSQTAEAFGMMGRTASKEQILAIYRAIYGFEVRESRGQQRVEGLIDEQRAQETLKAFDFLINNLGAVLKEFMHGLGKGRPEIK